MAALSALDVWQACGRRLQQDFSIHHEHWSGDDGLLLLHGFWLHLLAVPHAYLHVKVAKICIRLDIRKDLLQGQLRGNAMAATSALNLSSGTHTQLYTCTVS